jgi:hypothetical protein
MKHIMEQAITHSILKKVGGFVRQEGDAVEFSLDDF